MCFAYALPYTYSDLISDLENSKRFLLASNGGIVVNQQIGKSRATKTIQKSIFKGYGESERGQGQPLKRKRLKEQREDKAVLTKYQIAAREMKNMAIKTAKERMG